MPRPPARPRRPSQTWAKFVRNQLVGTIAIDFLTVPTATFGVLYVFFVLSLGRRRVLHVNVTAHPYAAWAAQQIIEALGPDISVRRLIRDRDGIFGSVFDARIGKLGVHQCSSLRALQGDAPITRAIETASTGRVVALQRVGGLHHRYARRAA